MKVSQDVIDQGAGLYAAYCSYCHGVGVISGDTIPDLRRLPGHFHDSFQQIVHGGAFKGIGMPGFGDVLSESDVDAIHAYVIEKAHEDKALRESPAWWLAIKQFFYEIAAWIIGILIGGAAHSA
jgi:quinohemoprotein ethanol dehydrogenase